MRHDWTSCSKEQPPALVELTPVSEEEMFLLFILSHFSAPRMWMSQYMDQRVGSQTKTREYWLSVYWQCKLSIFRPEK